MRYILISLLLLFSLCNADLINDIDNNTTALQKEHIKKIKSYLFEIKQIESEISKENVWVKSYLSYLASLEVKKDLDKIKKRIRYLKRKRRPTQAQKDELNSLVSKEKIIRTQLEQLRGKGGALFSELLTPPKIENIPQVENPFEIFQAFSFMKILDKDFQNYTQREEKLKDVIVLLKQENELYKKILKLDDEKKYAKQAAYKAKQLERFETALETINVTIDVYQKRLEVIELKLNKAIKEQTYRLVHIGTIIFVVFLIFLFLKLIIKRYITDNERFYMANKIINFTNITIIIFILFFNYIENASYLVTILGFASAGIAIAMKDWFMSILGWLVIVFGGSIHVGDRIRVDMDGMRYVGDVLDISLLRMTVLEDITLTAVTKNRRAGRIIFVPNNYIFTRMIANYTHSSLKTVWDGVHITITFESNHKKAMHLAKEITRKFSKGYTDITRKQLNKLRSKYNLKNTNVEPRIYSFIEPNGISIDCWYLTNAYATLTLRSVISLEILEAFKAEDDITIAYPTQMLHLQKAKKPPFDTDEIA